MSAILGPIHYWMFNKIKWQEDSIKAMLQLNDEKGLVPNLAKKLDDEAGISAKGELSEIIDVNNIHSWLAREVDIMEKRKAIVVKELLSKDETILDKLCEVLKKRGEEARLEHAELITPDSLFDAACCYMLDGMPCDGGIDIINKDTSMVVWEVSLLIHKPYYDEVGLDIEIFLTLRDAFLKGFFGGSSSVVYERIGETTFQLIG